MNKCDNTRRILEYCREALDEIREQEPMGATWVRRWASLLALLRTASLILEGEAPEWWKREMVAPNAHIKGRDAKKDWDPPIFGKFIWTDSNLFLHQGKQNTGQSVAVFAQGASAQALASGGSEPSVPSPASPRKTEVSYRMNSGYFENHNPLDIAEMAIIWLQQAIETAEAEAR